MKTFTIIIILVIGLVVYAVHDHTKNCEAKGGVMVNGVKDCWVEGRGYINAYED